MTQQEQLEAILEEALLVWKQDYPKSDGDNGLLMDEYFERLEKAKLKATQAITALIQEAVNEGRAEPKNAPKGVDMASPEADDSLPCEDCGSKYQDWTLLPHELFNQTCPNGVGILCLECFCKRRLDQLSGGSNNE